MKWKHSSATINFLNVILAFKHLPNLGFRKTVHCKIYPKRERYDMTGRFPVVSDPKNNDFLPPTPFTNYGKIDDLETQHSDSLFNWASLLEPTGSDKHSNYT